jgi:hypothetical protein
MFNARIESNHGNIRQSSVHEEPRAHKGVLSDTCGDIEKILVIVLIPQSNSRAIPPASLALRIRRSFMIQGWCRSPTSP